VAIVRVNKSILAASKRGGGEHPNPIYFSTSHRRFNIFFFFYSFCFEDRRKGKLKKFLKGKGKFLKEKR